MTNDNNTPPPSNGRAAVAGVSALALVVAGLLTFSHPWEGGRAPHNGPAVGYADPLAHGLPTACGGVTGAGVVVGRHYTAAECDALEQRAAIAHVRPVLACIPPLSLNTSIAVADLAYNVGPGRFCGSTMARLFRAHRDREACAQFSAYVYVGHRDCRIAANGCRGIPRRRAAERQLCERGL